jgi:hypothetical protein
MFVPAIMFICSAVAAALTAAAFGASTTQFIGCGAVIFTFGVGLDTLAARAISELKKSQRGDEK